MRVSIGSALLFLGLVVVAPAARVSGQDYKVVKKAALGGDGGWDYLKVDAEARRLYISRATRVMVVDADTLGPIGEIADTPGVHGIAIARDLGRGFTSNGRDNTVTIFDLASLKSLGRVKTGTNPDAVLYDEFTHRVFAFNGRSGDVTVIDAKPGTVAGTIPVGGKLEFAVTDGAGRIFVNVEDKNEIAVLDARAMKLTAHWPLADCQEPSGLAIDVAHRRLFAVCGNKHMAVVDTDQGRLVATVAIGDGPDAAAFDPERQLAFSSNGDGTLTVVHEVSPEKFDVVQSVPTQKSARTMALDPKTHNVFLVAAEFGERPAPTPEQPRPRPPVLPGSFTVLVVGR
jgi:DNA-binding beta-propeller fold protein YncE